MKAHWTSRAKRLIVDQSYEIVELVELAYREGTAAHVVEKGLFQKLLEMGYQALRYLFALHGACDEGERVELSDGAVVKRLPQPHARAYQSVFGAYELERYVYGSREGQKLESIPLDVRLQLPESKFSSLLQDWDQSLAVETPYTEVNAILQRILGLSVSVQSLERTNRSLGQSVESYWDNQVEVEPAQGAQLVVGTADGKGVVMRKSAEEKAVDEPNDQDTYKPACMESKPPKSHSGKQKMAILGAAYSIEPNPRTPEEVLESLFRTPDGKRPEQTAKPRPKPLCKHLRASLQRDEADTLQAAREEICHWLADEYRQRNPCGTHPQILIMDGEEKLWEMGDGRWEMGDGRWEMGDGRWEMGDGRWEMGDGRWEMGDGRWEMGDGRWEMGDGRWEKSYNAMALSLKFWTCSMPAPTSGRRFKPCIRSK
jgi:hypothetical protein